MATPEPSASSAQQTMERLLRLLVQKNGSDLYISAHAQPMVRLHGLCVPASSRALGPQDPERLLAALVGEQHAKALRPPHSLQQLLSLPEGGRLRVHGFFQNGSLAFTARYLPATLPSVGPGPAELAPALRALAKATGGLLLLAGSAGAGKSTTAAALMECRNAEISGHILTLEENIEYPLASKKSLVHQLQVGADTASWPSAVAHASRCAADVVYTSEITDAPGAQAALALAQAGVLCIATLRANSTVDALIRFLQYFPQEQRQAVQMQLGITLQALVLQKLLRTKAGPRVAVCEILAPSARIVQLIERGDWSQLRAVDLSQQTGCQSQAQDMLRLQSGGLEFEDAVPLPAADGPSATWGNTLFAEVVDSGRPSAFNPSAGTSSLPITLSLKS